MEAFGLLRICSRLCAVLAWVTFIAGLGIDGILLIVLQKANQLRTAEGALDRVVPLWPILLGTVLVLVGTLAFFFWKKHRWIGFAGLLVGALVLAAMGLHLRQLFPETIHSAGIVGGYDSLWKLFYRHMLPLVTALTAVLAFVLRERAQDKADMLAIRGSIIHNTTPRIFNDEDDLEKRPQEKKKRFRKQQD